MGKEKGYFFLDDSFNGLNEKIEKEYIRELKKESYEELLEDAKKEGIENPELYNKKELIEKFKELPGLED